MKDEDVVERISKGAWAREDGSHILFVRVRVRCVVGDHVLQKDFTVDEWDEEMRKPESWSCADHSAT